MVKYVKFYFACLEDFAFWHIYAYMHFFNVNIIKESTFDNKKTPSFIIYLKTIKQIMDNSCYLKNY